MSKDGRSETLEIRIESEIDDTRFPAGTNFEEVHRDAVELRRRTGRDTPGVRLIGYFRNPDRRNSSKARWKSTDESGQSLGAFFESLGAAITALMPEMQTGLSVDRSGETPAEPEGTPEERLFLKRSAAATRGAETRRKDQERAVKLAASLKRSRASKAGQVKAAATREAKRHKFL